MTRATATTTPPERLRGTAAPGANPLRGLIREVLGRAHYERMRAGMYPHLALPAWEDLPGQARELYRSRLDYVVPALLAMAERLRREARDEMHADLLDEGLTA